jgi:hypothetical protein
VRLRRLPAVVAALAAVTLVCAAPRATADEAPQPYPLVSLSSPSGTVTGSFTITAEVDLAGASGVSIRPDIRYTSGLGVGEKTVTAQDCPSTCQVNWEVDTTSWEHAIGSGTLPIDVSWSSTDPVPVYGGLVRYLAYDAPVEASWVSATTRDPDPDAELYYPAVFNIGGTVVASSELPREPDEVLDVRLYAGAYNPDNTTPVLHTTTTWSTSPNGDGRYTGQAHLDTSALPEGDYVLYMKSRNAAGQWGAHGGDRLVVRHTPAVTIDAASPALQTFGGGTTVSARLMRPMTATWSALRVSVDGATPQVLSNTYWSVPDDASKPVTSTASLPQPLSPGTHTITTEVLDTTGKGMGQPRTSTVRVVEFTNESATVPPLVLGQTSHVTLKGTAPTGLTYQSCYFGFYERTGMIGGGGACAPGATSYTKSIAWTPQSVGTGKVEFANTTVQGPAGPLHTIPVTVYARRGATLSAPSSSAFGARLTATVSVRDVKTWTGSPVAAPGVAVSLQRRTAGTTTWVTIMNGKTNSYGNVALPFTNSVNGRLRAVVTSTVPGRTLTTSERSVTSVSTVSWSSLPTWVRSGSTAYAAVYARPYEKSALVRVQTRRIGGTWATLGSAYVSTSSYAKAGFRLYSRGTWEVRVVRPATTGHGAGYSSTRRITVG